MREVVGRELRRRQAPIDVPAPTGAFYYFLRVRTNLPALTLVERLIKEHRVAVMPGSAFGATDGCYLRLSYGTVDEPTAIEGLRRLTTGIGAVTGSTA
jgi:aspartate/methionine/tyrosine aminotransferase